MTIAERIKHAVKLVAATDTPLETPGSVLALLKSDPKTVDLLDESISDLAAELTLGDVLEIGAMIADM